MTDRNALLDTDGPPCERCDDSGYIELTSGGLGGGMATFRHVICECPCGDDVRRELKAKVASHD